MVDMARSARRSCLWRMHVIPAVVGAQPMRQKRGLPELVRGGWVLDAHWFATLKRLCIQPPRVYTVGSVSRQRRA